MNQKSEQAQIICYAGGKSAGHILPCITRAREIIKRYPGYRFLFFTSDASLDATVLQQSALPSVHIRLRLMNVPTKKKWYLLPLFTLQLFISFIKSLWYLLRNKPQRVVTTGSYIAIPVVIAARVLRIPVELHALDAVPGKALTFLTPFAQVISLVFRSTIRFFPANKCIMSAYPVRFTKHDRITSAQNARELLGLDPHTPTLFVLGGSQGSQFLNGCVQTVVEQLSVTHKTQIIHQTGAQQTQAVADDYTKASIPHVVFSYNDKLAVCFQAADMVIARAGAGTLFECAFFRKKTVVIPLVSATTSHQEDNARAIVQEYPDLFYVFDQKEIAQSHKLLLTLLQRTFAQMYPHTIQSCGAPTNGIKQQESR